MFENETYTLENPENFKMINTRNFDYTLVMESSQVKLNNFICRNMVDKRLKFEFMDKPDKHLKMLVDNLNERDEGCSVGDCVDSVEKFISYNYTNCLDALCQIADEFETEWEIINKVIHLCRWC